MSIYDTLNNEQREAVYYTDGPLLILAGAGSGKTRVLTHRIAYLIEEKGVNPWNIMAITFTNKAAGEMRERVDNIVGFGAESIWVSTFHSSCVRILRRYIDKLGYDNNFTIYDTDDQKQVMKSICKKLDIDTKKMKEKSLLAAISGAKNEFISPEQYALDNQSDYVKKKIGVVYKEYQETLKNNNALDFDDLLVKCVELFMNNPDILDNYQERFKYIMVDEYQDTNTVQFKFVSMLANKYRNLCVVGDDDQSIYKFRGANIRNILDFEEVFPDTKVIKLEQNYRSTGNILKAANEVIKNNRTRKAKALWTEKEDGAAIKLRAVSNAYEEAEIIAEEIKEMIDDGGHNYSDIACLYRTNAQSRILEEEFIRENIPYKIFGGINFYQRKEIKDILAYLKTVDNARDDLAVKRIINVPKRGIGATTIEKIQRFADANNMSFYDATLNENLMDILGRAASKVQSFTYFIQTLRAFKGIKNVQEITEYILDETGYIQELENEDSDESRARLENIEEFMSKVVEYQSGAQEPTLSGFLEEVALVAEIDALDENNDYVVLMTIHSAKGLEFPKVFLCGMEDGLFPGYMSISSDDPTEIEEERRLCYVAITRAMESLTITSARSRMINGNMQISRLSRFVEEIPNELFNSNVSGAVMRKDKFERMEYERQQHTTPREIMKTKPFNPSQFKVTKADKLEYDIGDTVKHIKFGIGIVEDIHDGGRDYEVTVNFEKVGVKKMFASFAKLVKI